jgi:hypothetical protein
MTDKREKAVVEAKRMHLKDGLAQAIAYMVAAQQNRRRLFTPRISDTIYGIVSTGTNWQFLSLEDTHLVISGYIPKHTPKDVPTKRTGQAWMDGLPTLEIDRPVVDKTRPATRSSGQIAEYIRLAQAKYGFISTYEETLFLKQEQCQQPCRRPRTQRLLLRIC